MHKFARTSLAVLCIVYVTILVMRSATYALRTAKEFIHPNRDTYLPQVQPCQKLATPSPEQSHLQNYRNLGQPCAN